MTKVLKRVGLWTGIFLVVIVILAGATILIAGLLYRDPGQAPTRSGLPHERSLYLTMQDGTRIAADVWLPTALTKGERVPVLIKGTPYWRAAGLTFFGKALSALGLEIASAEPDVAILNAHGYAVITVDTRGTGASFGHQRIAFDDVEVHDFGEVIDWAAKQPWSSGRVGAYGFSYRGMLAVSMASLGKPALKAIAPSFDITDLYLITHPGGVFNERFLKRWGEQTGILNRGELPCEGLCKWLAAGPKPVDADRDGKLLAAAIAEHSQNYDVYACSKQAPDRDSPTCGSGKTLTEVSEIARERAVERSGIPIYVIVGYFDSTSPAGALQRFRTFTNPQQIVLGAISHGGFTSTDPFAEENASVDPSYRKQIDGIADFFDRYTKPRGAPIAKVIRYKVLNGGGWKTTTHWPPDGAEITRFYPASDHALSRQEPSDAGDSYNVDFSATTGEMSRYQSPVDLSRTSYPERAKEDRKLLTYTSAPLASDVKIAGDPTAGLRLASSSPDGAVIVYLEDVRPDGSVVYLTEGVLRLAQRKLSEDRGEAVSSDPLHTYLKRDKAPMTPGRSETVEFSLSPIAAIFRKGERIRVAIAGADAENLERIPATGPETFTIMRGADTYLELPVLSMR